MSNDNEEEIRGLVDRWRDKIASFLAQHSTTVGIAEIEVQIHRPEGVPTTLNLGEILQQDPLRRFAVSGTDSSTRARRIYRVDDEEIKEYVEELRTNLAAFLSVQPVPIGLSDIGSQVTRPARIPASVKLIDVMRHDPQNRFTIIGEGSFIKAYYNFDLTEEQSQSLIQQWRENILRLLSTQSSAMSLQDIAMNVQRPYCLPHSITLVDVLKSDPQGLFILSGEGPTLRCRRIYNVDDECIQEFVEEWRESIARFLGTQYATISLSDIGSNVIRPASLPSSVKLIDVMRTDEAKRFVLIGEGNSIRAALNTASRLVDGHSLDQPGPNMAPYRLNQHQPPHPHLHQQMQFPPHAHVPLHGLNPHTGLASQGLGHGLKHANSSMSSYQQSQHLPAYGSQSPGYIASQNHAQISVSRPLKPTAGVYQPSFHPSYQQGAPTPTHSPSPPLPAPPSLNFQPRPPLPTATPSASRIPYSNSLSRLNPNRPPSAPLQSAISDTHPHFNSSQHRHTPQMLEHQQSFHQGLNSPHHSHLHHHGLQQFPSSSEHWAGTSPSDGFFNEPQPERGLSTRSAFGSHDFSSSNTSLSSSPTESSSLSSSLGFYQPSARSLPPSRPSSRNVNEQRQDHWFRGASTDLHGSLLADGSGPPKRMSADSSFDGIGSGLSFGIAASGGLYGQDACSTLDLLSQHSSRPSSSASRLSQAAQSSSRNSFTKETSEDSSASRLLSSISNATSPATRPPTNPSLTTLTSSALLHDPTDALPNQLMQSLNLDSIIYANRSDAPPGFGPPSDNTSIASDDQASQFSMWASGNTAPDSTIKRSTPSPIICPVGSSKTTPITSPNSALSSRKVSISSNDGSQNSPSGFSSFTFSPSLSSTSSLPLFNDPGAPSDELHVWLSQIFAGFQKDLILSFADKLKTEGGFISVRDLLEARRCSQLSFEFLQQLADFKIGHYNRLMNALNAVEQN